MPPDHPRPKRANNTITMTCGPAPPEGRPAVWQEKGGLWHRCHTPRESGPAMRLNYQERYFWPFDRRKEKSHTNL